MNHLQGLMYLMFNYDEADTDMILLLQYRPKKDTNMIE